VHIKYKALGTARDNVHLRVLQAHAQQLAAIAEDTAVLHISAAALDKDEGGQWLLQLLAGRGMFVFDAYTGKSIALYIAARMICEQQQQQDSAACRTWHVQLVMHAQAVFSTVHGYTHDQRAAAAGFLHPASIIQHAHLPTTTRTAALRPADKLRSRFVRWRFSLAAAIQEDAALEGLSEAEILEQVRSKVRKCS
jgi:hypothetical protein